MIRNEQLSSKFQVEKSTLDYTRQVQRKLTEDRQTLQEQLKSQRVFLAAQKQLLQSLRSGNAEMVNNIDAADAALSNALEQANKTSGEVLDFEDGPMTEDEKIALSGHPREYFEELIMRRAAEALASSPGQIEDRPGLGLPSAPGDSHTSLEWDGETDGSGFGSYEV